MLPILLYFLIALSLEVSSNPVPIPEYYDIDLESNVALTESSVLDVNNYQIFTPLSNIDDTVNAKITQAIEAKKVEFVTPFPSAGKQEAILESAIKESVPIQADIKYGNFQQFVAGLLNLKPIVDTIQEHEKYGNDGGKGRAIGTQVVAAFEGLSNALNAAVDTPFRAAKTVGRKITESLNQIGGKLVGLA